MEVEIVKWNMETGKRKREMETGRMALVGHRSNGITAVCLDSPR